MLFVQAGLYEYSEHSKLLLSSALPWCVTIIRNLLILRVSFKQKQTQSTMQTMKDRSDSAIDFGQLQKFRLFELSTMFFSSEILVW